MELRASQIDAGFVNIHLTEESKQRDQKDARDLDSISSTKPKVPKELF